MSKVSVKIKLFLPFRASVLSAVEWFHISLSNKRPLIRIQTRIKHVDLPAVANTCDKGAAESSYFVFLNSVELQQKITGVPPLSLQLGDDYIAKTRLMVG